MLVETARNEVDLDWTLREEGIRREQLLNAIRASLLVVLGLVSWTQFSRSHFLGLLVFDQGLVVLGLAGCLALKFGLAKASRGSLHVAAVILDLSLVVATTTGHALLGLESATGTVGAQFDAVFSFVFVVGATSGMRFDAHLARVTTAACAAAVVAAFVFDSWVIGVPFSPISFAIKTAAALACAYLGLVTVRRTRQLILKRVEQEVMGARVRQEFARYVSQDVASHILESGSAAIVGTRQETTILFADIRGFTSMAEKMPPEAVVAELNEYFNEMVDAIFQYGGTVDKFMGDGLMAIFGAPISQEDHALRAARAAIAMRHGLENLNERRSQRDMPPLRIGIGLHTGECIIGNIGTPVRLDYTAIGDAVNTASRLESLCKDFNVDVIASGGTVMKLAGHADVRPLSAVVPRGKTDQLELFHLIGVHS